MYAKGLALAGLGLDIIGVFVVGLRGDRWMLQYWRDAPSIFDTRLHKWMYYGAWWAILLGFVLQALAVIVQ